ncbi:hypothetical protein CF326_g483 [Tilletia indica]|nr:hypothetical protein CF326_g483 [Tilletia indica]
MVFTAVAPSARTAAPLNTLTSTRPDRHDGHGHTSAVANLTFKKLRSVIAQPSSTVSPVRARTVSSSRPSHTPPRSASIGIVGLMDIDGFAKNGANVATSVFFVTYVVFETPSPRFFQLVGFRRAISAIPVAWGITTLCTDFVMSYAGLLATLQPRSRFAPSHDSKHAPLHPPVRLAGSFDRFASRSTLPAQLLALARLVYRVLAASTMSPKHHRDPVCVGAPALPSLAPTDILRTSPLPRQRSSPWQRFGVPLPMDILRTLLLALPTPTTPRFPLSVSSSSTPCSVEKDDEFSDGRYTVTPALAASAQRNAAQENASEREAEARRQAPAQHQFKKEEQRQSLLEAAALCKATNQGNGPLIIGGRKQENPSNSLTPSLLPLACLQPHLAPLPPLVGATTSGSATPIAKFSSPAVIATAAAVPPSLPTIAEPASLTTPQVNRNNSATSEGTARAPASVNSVNAGVAGDPHEWSVDSCEWGRAKGWDEATVLDKFREHDHPSPWRLLTNIVPSRRGAPDVQRTTASCSPYHVRLQHVGPLSDLVIHVIPLKPA